MSGISGVSGAPPPPRGYLQHSDSRSLDVKALTLIALLSCASAAAQVSIGLQAGPAFSTINNWVSAGDDRVQLGQDWMPTYAAGVSVEFALTPRHSLQTGLHYVAQGERKYLSFGNGDQAFVRTTFSTAEAPIALRYRFATGVVSLSTVAGASFQYVYSIRSRVRSSEAFRGFGESFARDYRDQLRRASLNAVLAVEAAAALPFGEAFAEVRYRHQLTDLAAPEAATWRFQSIAPTVGLRVGLMGSAGAIATP